MTNDDKYVVLKRETFDSLLNGIEDNIGNVHKSAFNASVLTDAVVIRTRDAFAGPALHGYAANIALAASLLASSGDEKSRADARRLIDIGDYFHARAIEADAQAAVRLPD